MAVRPACIAIVVLWLQLTAYANEIDAQLEILPSGETQTKPIGSSIILTCKPKMNNPTLVEDMQWLDPQNRVIDSLNTQTGFSKPAMYTEMHQDHSLSLFFNSLQADQAGRYTCKGTYANSIPLNKSVTIDTIIAITWEDAPLNQYPIIGEDSSIMCKVVARPSPSVDWLYNGELIRTNKRYVINAHSLKIKNVQESDDGIYTCRASVQTTGELKERLIRVEGHTRPVIEEISSPVNIVEGENANIECKATGKPPPIFTWIKSLAQQNLSATDRFGVNSITGVLTITNVKREDAGEYQCIATNAADRATINIQVNVIIKPKIMEFLNKTVVLTKDTDIVCKAFARPPPVVIFRKFTTNKEYVMGVQPQDDRLTMTNKPNDVSGETIGILSIRNVLISDDGLYECVAKNAGGVAHKSGHLTVEFPPSFSSMGNVTVYTWDKRPVNLTCIAESIPNATIQWTLHEQSLEGNPAFKVIGNGPISTLEVTPVNDRYYSIYKCIAMNPHGRREHLIELKMATKPNELLSAKMVELTATTIKFDLIPPTHPDLPIQSISVQYNERTFLQNWNNAKNRTWSVGSIYVVENLKPLTSYDFRFATRNDVGQSNWGTYLEQTTPGKTVPREPTILTTPGSEYEQSAFNNQYELSWVVPNDNGGEPINKYRIEYCQIRQIAGKWEELENTCVKDLEVKGTRQYLKGLSSDTIYKVKLEAHNALGYSTPAVAKFRTARGTDTSVLQHQGPLLTSGAVIGIVVATILIFFIIIDAFCCCVRKTGIIYIICERSRRKPVDEEDAKLGRDEKEPLKEEKKITPIIDSGLRRETSITFDGKRSISKTGFVGKDSAV